MILLRFLMSLLQTQTIPTNFIPIQDCANLNEEDINSIKALQYNKAYSNSKRFKTINEKLFVHKNYKAMMSEDLQTNFYKALIIAKNQTNLAKQISLLSGMKQTTLERYFIRFTFVQVKKAENVIGYIKQYINQNCLFGMELSI